MERGSSNGLRPCPWSQCQPITLCECLMCMTRLQKHWILPRLLPAGQRRSTRRKSRMFYSCGGFSAGITKSFDSTSTYAQSLFAGLTEIGLQGIRIETQRNCTPRPSCICCVSLRSRRMKRSRGEPAPPGLSPGSSRLTVPGFCLLPFEFRLNPSPRTAP
jgi:hypothetical protein